MNNTSEFTNAKYAMAAKYDASAIEHPEFQKFIKEVVKAIARQTKRAALALWGVVAEIWRYLEKKSREGQHAHDRLSLVLDERYRQNGFHLRGHL